MRGSAPETLIAVARTRYCNGEIQKIKGNTVTYPDWWFNLRASNTEPVVKLVIGANSPATLGARRAQVQRELSVQQESSHGGQTARPDMAARRAPRERRTPPTKTRFMGLT